MVFFDYLYGRNKVKIEQVVGPVKEHVLSLLVHTTASNKGVEKSRKKRHGWA